MSLKFAGGVEGGYVNSDEQRLVDAAQVALFRLAKRCVFDFGEQPPPVYRARLALTEAENFIRNEYKLGHLPKIGPDKP